MRKIAVFLLLMCMFCVQAEAMVPSLSVFGGFSKDRRTLTDNQWEAGWNAGVNLFFGFPGKGNFGLHLSIHQWSIDGAGWMDWFDSRYNFESGSGTQTLIEIVPSYRQRLALLPGNIRFDMNSGIGFYLIHLSRIKVTASYRDIFEYRSAEHTQDPSDHFGIGVQLGPSVVFAKRIELQILLSLYFREGDLYNHIAFNLGFVIF